MRFRQMTCAAAAAGLGLAAAAAALAQGSSAAPSPPRFTGLDGWALAGEREGLRLYVKPEPVAGRLARLSTRVEYYGTEGPFSSVALEEYDCTDNRQRMRSSTSYEQINLAGPPDVSNEITPWFEAKPDTVEYALQRIACQDGQPRAAQAILTMDPVTLPPPPAPAIIDASAIPNTAGWLQWTQTPAMALMGLPAAPVGGRARVWLRMELLDDPEPSYRSGVSLQEVDCARRRLRTLQDTFYPKNGLQGERDLRAGASRWEAVRPDTIHERVYEVLCDGKTPRPILGGAADPGGVWAWMGVETMDWVELGRDSDEATFALQGPRGDHPRLWLRSEWRTPRGEDRFLSMTQLYDFDCEDQRYRVIQRTPYKAHNMTSELATDATVGPWAFFTPGSQGEQLFKVACGVEDDVPTAAPAAAPAQPVKL